MIRKVANYGSQHHPFPEILFLLSLFFTGAIPASLLGKPPALETQAKISPDIILTRIDDNMFAETIYARTRMVITNRRGRKRTLKLISWQRGDKESFSEYLSPKKEKGTKMLKLNDNLWTYSPRTDRIIRIAGHLLRRSIMGSDLSYEDSMEEERLREKYHAVIEKEIVYQGKKVWVLKLTAREEGLAYPLRRLWVSQRVFLPLKGERYGRSGRLLKTVTIKEIKKIDGRYYPINLNFKDELKSGKGTDLIMDEIHFNPKLPANVFSRRSLRK